MTPHGVRGWGGDGGGAGLEAAVRPPQQQEPSRSGVSVG